jgi:nucleotide-binding universal stress UspA family protein
VLVVPHDFAAELAFDTVVIAWDGSMSAARAAWNAVPLLKAAKRVIVTSVTGEKDLGKAAPGTGIAKMLAAAGLKVEAVSLATGEATVAATLLKQASDISAGLVVLGAYGHARWREFVFGGVTRHMLATAKLPLLMSN